MPNFASCTIVGHLGRDADLKEVGDTRKLSFSIATSRKRTDRKTGEIQETTTWWNCAMWGDRAAKVAEYLTKGKAVLVQGEVYLREYEAKDGGKGHSLEVEVREVVLLGGGEDRKPAAREEAPAGETIGRDGLRRHVPRPAAADDDSPPF